jgi:hypothetical protein
MNARRIRAFRALSLEPCQCGGPASVVETRAARGVPTCKACALSRARDNYARRKDDAMTRRESF